MRYDVVVGGGGTAGCVLSPAQRDPDRRVCLLGAGSDYGPLPEGRWPPEILDASEIATSHGWGPSDDGRSFGGRLVGGSSTDASFMPTIPAGEQGPDDCGDRRADRREPVTPTRD